MPLLFALLLACSGDKKLPLGTGEGPQLFEKILYSDASQDAFYTFKNNTGSSLHLLLGQANDEYKARLLLSFATFPDSVDRVESAKITLYSWDVLGDTASAPFNANVYRLLSDWTETSIKEWNEVTADNMPLGSAEIYPEIGDSVEFELPVDLVETWIDTSSGEENFGVSIEAENATFMVDFYSREALLNQSPILEIIYEHNGEPDTVNILSNRDVFVIEENLNLDDDHLYIGKGVAARSVIRFNVLDNLDSTATINRAELILKIDDEKSLFDAMGAGNITVMRISNEADDPQDLVIDSTFSGYAGSVLNDTVTVNITSLFQMWSANDPSFVNYGLMLQSTGESETIARTAFYGSSADSLLAPRILIRYTLPPREDFY